MQHFLLVQTQNMILAKRFTLQNMHKKIESIMLSVCLRNVVFPRNFPSGKLPIPVNNTGILPVSGILLLVTVADTKMYYFHVLPIAEVILFRQIDRSPLYRYCH